jgi:hypothetical protein
MKNPLPICAPDEYQYLLQNANSEIMRDNKGTWHRVDALFDDE